METKSSCWWVWRDGAWVTECRRVRDEKDKPDTCPYCNKEVKI